MMTLKWAGRERRRVERVKVEVCCFPYPLSILSLTITKFRRRKSRNHHLTLTILPLDRQHARTKRQNENTKSRRAVALQIQNFFFMVMYDTRSDAKRQTLSLFSCTFSSFLILCVLSLRPDFPLSSPLGLAGTHLTLCQTTTSWNVFCHLVFIIHTKLIQGVFLITTSTAILLRFASWR
jgi:hypothetical protein